MTDADAIIEPEFVGFEAWHCPRCGNCYDDMVFIRNELATDKPYSEYRCPQCNATIWCLLGSLFEKGVWK
jgi:predicted RNA-binding Zn-ribbon protein involved in translation (DUF1610 family)